MRFRDRSPAPLPEINLIPMLNVMMGILAFFVMITMSLTTQQGVEVPLPDRPETAANQPDAEPFIINLTLQGIVLNDQPLTEAQLLQQVEVYLAANPQGFVVLQAAPALPYDSVVQLLGQLKDVGGDRVSLAID
jgi:biopolymer transport protein ExbD